MDTTVTDMGTVTVVPLLLIPRDRKVITAGTTVTAMVAQWLLTPKERKVTTVDTTVVDMVIATVALLSLIPWGRKVTTVDITVKDMVTAMVALLPLIPRHRKVTTVDSIPDMVDTTTTKRIQFKLSFFFLQFDFYKLFQTEVHLIEIKSNLF